jgi:hypothetical protein
VGVAVGRDCVSCCTIYDFSNIHDITQSATAIKGIFYICDDALYMSDARWNSMAHGNLPIEGKNRYDKYELPQGAGASKADCFD